MNNIPKPPPPSPPRAADLQVTSERVRYAAMRDGVTPSSRVAGVT